MVISVLYFAILGLTIASMWKVFEKAGQPGWAAIVPIYNVIILVKIVNKPSWWVILFFVPIVNFVVAIIIAIELAKSFGKEPVFAAGLVLLPFVFYPILAFGPAQYLGLSGGSGFGGQAFGAQPFGAQPYGAAPQNAQWGASPMQAAAPMQSQGFGQTPMQSQGFGQTPMQSQGFGQTPMQSAPAPVSATPPGWNADPSGRNQFRYWDGTGWTGHVSNNGIQSTDGI